jgi:prepilin-type N-terminal cleavage/methylation domain-containing protein
VYSSKTRGFTLVELMVVIVIVGILAALAIPRFMGASNRTKATEFKPFLKQIYTLQVAHKADKGEYSADLSQLGFEVPSPLSARFEYKAIAIPVSSQADAEGPENALGLASPTAPKGVAITFNGTNLNTNDNACVDSKGALFADVPLAGLTVLEAGNCPDF